MLRRAVVTGAFSYSGGVIARRLLDQGFEVVSLSRSVAPAGHPLAGIVSVEPLQFGDAEALVRALSGAEVLFNTYWIRFGRRGATFDRAVENSRVLFAAARRAGVGRIVHLSVTNASASSPFAYFRGKAAVERVLAETTSEHAVIRPSLVFGGRAEILINNMAWLLRRLPVYAVPGDGAYRVQPVAVDDVADLALAAGLRTGSSVEDAVGPEVYSFDEFLALLARAVTSRARLVHLPAPVVVALGRPLGLLLRDVVITREELGALTAGLLTSDAPPTGHTSFADWLPSQSDWLGRRYANELERNWLAPKTR
jgi:NADH dehydrogenase